MQVSAKIVWGLWRLRIDIAEAWRESAGEPGNQEPTESVKHKYDSQAPYYSASAHDAIEPLLLDRILTNVERGGQVLVVGSGVGTECCALHEAGYRVHGIDFSPAMVESARKIAQDRKLDIDFTQGDIRSHREPAGSLVSILFTYDVYSFLPFAAERIELLRRMTGWLAPGATLFLSARLVRRAYIRALLTIQWMRAGSLKTTAWGGSHTRYLTSDGVLHRSFVQYFTLKRLQREVRAAGLAASAFHGGHFELRGSGRSLE
jgi:2-polyprenyl-3-methyl-5-hydroxy-6-metoxy-1,4-benzoquinol methylase